ncbi:MAG TPA: hypothetical protein VMJ10_33195 [Kofleriaceae bacterium]|nr:hypothetical protein [Kofleriaceae bacterium]
MPTAAEVLERVFTTPNPTTGSQPPPQIAWVVFTHGTAFFTAPNEALPATSSLADLAAAAKAALVELGPVHAGTSSADFSPTRLAGWYPDEPVWFVGFDHPAIATVVVMDTSDLVAGMAARSARDRDHAEQTIVCVRGFDGRAQPE